MHLVVHERVRPHEGERVPNREAPLGFLRPVTQRVEPEVEPARSRVKVAGHRVDCCPRILLVERSIVIQLANLHLATFESF